MDEDKEKGMEELILEKAEELFLEKGYALTSTVEIARAAGCNQALVHYYYRTKEKLFQKIFLSKIGLFMSALLEIDDSSDEFFVKIRRKIEAHFDMLVRNPRLPFLILNELTINRNYVTFLKDELKKNRNNSSVYMNIEGALNEEIAKGTVRPMTVTDLIINIVSLNVFSFVSMPILQEVFDIDDVKKKTFIEHRREESVTTIINGMRP